MPRIVIETLINSKIEICFDLSRSIDLHQISTAETNEIAIAGKTSGLISLGEFVTWQATHFGVSQKLSSIITFYDRPNHFRDEQLKGIFKFFKHDHTFRVVSDKVKMTDIFEFESPFGVGGKLFNKIVLTKHLTKLLLKRNEIIKDFAESEKWKKLLDETLY